MLFPLGCQCVLKRARFSATFMTDSNVNILQSFEPISLEELNDINRSLKLLKRQDTKFVFPKRKLLPLMERLTRHYKILEIQDRRIFEYETLYFDTDDLAYYHQHHNSKANRYKFRYRRYVNSGLQYFEVKLKNNKKQTIKDRFKQDALVTEFSNDMADRIREKCALTRAIDTERLKPKIWTCFSRITLASDALQERVTIDIDLAYKNMALQEKKLDMIAIAEIKQDGLNLRSPFVQAAKEQRIYSSVFSKYCTGIILMENPRKVGEFKHRILSLNKLCAFA